MISLLEPCTSLRCLICEMGEDELCPESVDALMEVQRALPSITWQLAHPPSCKFGWQHQQDSWRSVSDDAAVCMQSSEHCLRTRPFERCFGYAAGACD